MAGVASSSSSSSEDLTQTGRVEEQPEGVDILLQRRKCELMYELKRLEHGERPVTGSDSRGKVDSFISKQLQRQESTAPVANSANVEEHRPQQVTIEVQGLIQNRSVSSVLQSQRFRRSLENVFRNHFTVTSRNQAAAPRQRAESTITSEDVSSLSTPSSQSTPAATTTASTTSSAATTASSSASIPRVPVEPLAHEHQNHDISAVAAERLRRWNQEQFVMEISELVHRQLVSSTLSGDFRNRLERHVGNRVAETGGNGQAVREFLLHLPPSNIQRNDFSHLGIPSVQDQQQQLDDAVSVISATASATIPFAQSNAAVQREMSAMKAQIAQLSNMLKMSLDLQLDIQRSIRQEVAAAISQSASSGQDGNVPTLSTQFNSRRANDSKCIVCLEGDADAVLYRCGHICMCYTCALRMKGESGICPVCRAPISDILRGYRISNDS